jgi:hypothetical protein
MSKWELIRSIFTGHSDTSSPDILNSDEFEERIQQERARVDRTGASFTLLSFTVLDSDGKPDGVNGQLNLLASVINERTRLSDVTGIHQNGHKRVAVLLPDTPYVKAFNLVNSIEENFTRKASDAKFRKNKAPELMCEVYSYPNEMTKEATITASINKDSFDSFEESNEISANLLVHERIG